MNETIALLINKGDRVFEDANYLYNERKSYDSAISRAYYALFYFGEAMLLTEGIVTSSHQGLSVMFSKHFVKTGRIEVNYGRIVANVFRKRQLSDYDFSTEVSEDIANEALNDVSAFINMAKAYLQSNGFVSDVETSE